MKLKIKILFVIIFKLLLIAREILSQEIQILQDSNSGSIHLVKEQLLYFDKRYLSSGLGSRDKPQIKTRL